MKKILVVILFSFVLFSCEKEKKFPENPGWLNAKISQMETSADYAGTIVYGYEWNSDYYYLISIASSSCAMCEFYSYQGVKVDWADDKVADFQKNGKEIKVVWQRTK